MSTLVYGTSIRGNGHYRAGIECQDSTSFCEKDFLADKIKLIALSDGHGEPTCQRSVIGANVATLIAREELYRCVLKLAPTLDELDTLNEIIKSPPRHIKREGDGVSAELSLIKDHASYLSSQISEALDGVKSKIIDKWRCAVLKDFSENPLAILSAEESIDETKLLLPAYASKTEKGILLSRQVLKSNAQAQITENPYIVYGATLLACAQYKEHIFLLKLGDGSITILDSDGKAVEPIKSKPEEIANATESLCQKYASKLMQSAYLKCKAKIILLCTDGVTNALDSEESLGELAGGLYESINEEPRKLRCEFNDFLRGFSDATDDDCSIGFIANEIDDYAYEIIKNTEDGEENEINVSCNAHSFDLEKEGYTLAWENNILALVNENGEKGDKLQPVCCTLTTLTLEDDEIKATKEEKKYLVLSSNDKNTTLANITEKLYNELIAE